MVKFLIVDSNHNGLCNQLWCIVIFAKLNSLEEYNVKYNIRDERLLGFLRFNTLWSDFLENRAAVKYCLNSRFFRKVARRIGFGMDVDFRKRKVTILENWRGLGLCLEILGSDFNVADFIQLKAKPLLLKSLRSDFVVIHARLGDYRVWRGGEYYYSPNYYIQLAQQIRIMYPSFDVVVCTNEPDKFLQAAEANILFLSQAKSEEEDLALMSKSRWILGPPSSFSSFASNFGGVALSWIFDETHSAQALYKSRSIISGFYKFQNGLALCDTETFDEKLELKVANLPRINSIQS